MIRFGRTFVTTAALCLAFRPASADTTGVASAIEKAYDLPTNTATSAEAINFESVSHLDNDQRIIVARLAGETEEAFVAAKKVFDEGANAEAYATLTISDPAFVGTLIPPGTNITGLDQNNNAIFAVTKFGSGVGISTIDVHYPVDPNFGGNSLCSVGGNPNPRMGGCFVATGGIAMVLGGVHASYAYSYNPLRDNVNGLSLSKIDDSRVQTNVLDKFLVYYTNPDFDKEWIHAAFEGRSTVGFGNGFYDFGKLDMQGRREALEIGMSAIRMLVFVANQLEDAFAQCGNLSALNNWDNAVAGYAGSNSLQGYEGYFLYRLAEVECQAYGTCGNPDDMIPLNQRIFHHFQEGKKNLMSQNCIAVAFSASTIINSMKVPLVQGLLRSIYELDKQSNTQGEIQGQIAAYAAAIMPFVHDCDEQSAVVLNNDLAPGKAIAANYEEIRDALERAYKCMGVTCEDVGGLKRLTGDGHLPGAGPCGMEDGPNNTSSSSSTTTTTTTTSSGSTSTSVATPTPIAPSRAPIARPTTKPTEDSFEQIQSLEPPPGSNTLQNELTIGLSVGAGIMAAVIAILFGIQDHRRAKQFDTGLGGPKTTAQAAAATEAAKVEGEGDAEDSEDEEFTTVQIV